MFLLFHSPEAMLIVTKWLFPQLPGLIPSMQEANHETSWAKQANIANISKVGGWFSFNPSEKNMRKSNWIMKPEGCRGGNKITFEAHHPDIRNSDDFGINKQTEGWWVWHCCLFGAFREFLLYRLVVVTLETKLNRINIRVVPYMETS